MVFSFVSELIELSLGLILVSLLLFFGLMPFASFLSGCFEMLREGRLFLAELRKAEKTLRITVTRLPEEEKTKGKTPMSQAPQDETWPQ